MRMITGLAIAVILSAATTAQADNADGQATPQAAAKVATATQKVDQAAPAQKVKAMTVSARQEQQVCPRCGKVHGPARAPVARRQQNQNMFQQVMELERRKNAWLRGLFR